MNIRTKNGIWALLGTVSEMAGAMEKMRDLRGAVADCLSALLSIANLLAKENPSAAKSLSRIEDVAQCFQHMENLSLTDKEKRAHCRLLKQKIYQLRHTIAGEVQAKLSVAFFPYKASMWNSLATIYEAAAKDESCETKVVVAPYYALSENEAKFNYEGDLFPKDVPITHFSQYRIETEQPDIVFVHNIYDQYNSITRLEETFFASNLRKYTNMLVYVPYCISAYKTYQQGEMHSEFMSPALQCADKIIALNDAVKEGLALNGVPRHKIIAMGSPKIDLLIRSLNEDDVPCPEEWREKLDGKTVYLLETGCMHFLDNIYLSMSEFIDTTLRILMASEKNALIWRPHPLTEAAMNRYAPEPLAQWYKYNLDCFKTGKLRLKNQSYVLDESPDYIPTFKKADVLVSRGGSLMYEFLATEKKIIYGACEFPPGFLFDSKAFYFKNHAEEGLQELVYKFCEGYDPRERHRRGMAKKVFGIADGTCGAQIYQMIKGEVLAGV